MNQLQRAALAAVVDPDRLAVLAGVDLDDVIGDAELDDLAREAAGACKTPVGLVTVLDANRQWNVGRHGSNLSVVPLGLSMCAHVVAGGVTVVGDLRFDDRFKDHPLVATVDGLRFYAGAPVRVGGIVAGAVAVADVRPRTLGPTGRSRLATLALDASAILQHRFFTSARAT